MTLQLPAAPAAAAVAVEPLPVGFRLDLDSSVKQLTPELITGGTPTRVLRLTAAGARAWALLAERPIASRAEGLLARRLTDAGLAHPVPPSPSVADTLTSADVTVVVPVLDRPQTLARCLAALDPDVRVLVVDDGSADPGSIAAVAAEHGARLVRREVNGGPAAARNTGLDAVRSSRGGHLHAVGSRVAACDVVAFLDSDCVPPAGWLQPLLAHLADPSVAAVAPRVVGTASGTWAGRYTVARGNLDLGTTPSRVRADARVAYVPTAAVVVRVSALLDIARDGYVFDPSLRYGEDVDLVWRLDAAGWRVRYQPGSCVVHHEPDRWRALLARRYRYGTSAAPLAAAHPRSTSPLVVVPWPALTVAALLARRPVPAAAAALVTGVNTRRVLTRAQVPTTGLAATTVRSVCGTWLGVGRYATQFAGPVLLALAAAPGRPGRRLAAASLLLGGPLTEWWSRREALDPVRFTVGYLADEIAYGAGVWSASLRRRTAAPLRPRVIRRSNLSPPPPAAPSTRPAPTKESPQ